VREEIEWHPSVLDEEVMTLLDHAGAKEVKLFTRRVHDGELHSIVSCEQPDYKWHLTVNHISRRKRGERYPTWEEVTHARYDLLPNKLVMALYLPPIEEQPASLNSLQLIEVKSVGD
jgi:hypothetical protein